MRLFSSNRLEQLLDLLAALVSRPLPPLEAEVILVQSQGMAHWLSMGLSQHLGVWTHAKFPFPLSLLTDIQKACGIFQDSKAWSPECLQWSVWLALQQHQNHPAFEILGQYMQNNHSPESHWQLSKRISKSFDEYMIYRPELLLSWDAGADPDDWQAILWRFLVANINVKHRAKLQQQVLNALKQGDIDIQLLPSRLSIFGVSSLPPIYLEILTQLGRYLEINVLLINPCEVYWGDLMNNYELAQQHFKHDTQDSSDLHLEDSNPLLASLGRLGRDFLELLYQYDLPSMTAFSPSSATHLLAQIQNNLLTLQQSHDKALELTKNDLSIQLHSCHSPMREIEVLYDQVLALFDHHTELSPADILVMAPDIEIYTPLIQSVFSNNKTRLPFSIADKPLREEGMLFDSFMNLLALPDSRLTIAEVLAFLDEPAIQQRFDIHETDLNLLIHWLEQAHIRWGIDGQSRAELDIPAFDEYSWKQGLDRLLLGYALPDKEQQLHDFEHIMPLDTVEGQDSLLLGKFLQYTEILFQYFDGLKIERNSADWLIYIEQMLNDLFENEGDHAVYLQQIRQGLQQLQQQQQLANFTQTYSIKIVAAWFDKYLNRELPAIGFMTGKITFCSLLPMRSIPFKVICLLGMNDKDFPRHFRAPSFDLVAAQPRKGDRSQRYDDRYLFLEALLSARQSFYVSYIGQSIKDNSVLQASTVVSVLQQYIENQWGTKTLENIQQQHALQAFDSCYFETPSLFFSYQQHFCQAGLALQNPNKKAAAFLTKPLTTALDSKTNNVIDLRQLLKFYQHPSRYFLQQSLALQTKLKLSHFDNQEPLQLEPLDIFKLKQALLERALQGQKPDKLQRWATADGQLPAAALSDIAYQKHWLDIKKLYQQIQQKRQQKQLESLNIDLNIGKWQLQGTLDQIYTDGLLRYHPAKTKLKHILDTWIQHLILNTIAPASYPRHSYHYFQDKAWQFLPVENSTALLKQLLMLFHQGQKQPLLYFPKSSQVYWKYRFEAKKPKTAEMALKKANKTWLFGNGDNHLAEAEELTHKRCFGQQSLEGQFGAEFIKINEILLQELAQYCQPLAPENIK